MMHSNPPMNIIEQFTTNATGSPSMLLSQGLPLPTEPNLNDPSQLTQIFWAFDPQIKLAQNMNWSAGIQRQLRNDLMLDVAYVGSRTNEMMNPINPNEALPGPELLGPRRPLYSVNPAIQDIQYRTNYGAEKYHSLQTNLEKRYGYGLIGHFAWTWSHNLSNTVGPNSGGPPQNSFCTACEWGPLGSSKIESGCDPALRAWRRRNGCYGLASRWWLQSRIEWPRPTAGSSSNIFARLLLFGAAWASTGGRHFPSRH
jgi:hypothetical protein